MTLIQELLDDLAPEGVKYVRLAEIAEVGTGSSNRNESSFSGQYPLFVRSKTIYRSDDFEFDEVAIVIPGEGGIGEIFHYVDGKYALHQRAYRIRIRDNSVDTKFVLYFMKAHFKKFILMKAVSATVTSIRKPMILDFRIPVPPLQVQQRIVEILDTFSSLEADLEAELAARKKQYEFYRNQLLTFHEQAGVRWVPMGEVVRNLDSKRKPITSSSRTAGPYPYYGANGIQDWVEGFIFDGTYLLVGEDGSVINKDNTPVLNWVEGKSWVNNHAHVLESKDENLNLRFLYHYLSTAKISEYVTGGSQLKINQSNLNKIPVPLPSLGFQSHVVDVLDKFDLLVNDISIGLPAELKARRKQYEYYRDKLLTFRELEA